MRRPFAVLVAVVAAIALSAGTAQARARTAAEPVGTITDTAIAVSGTDGPDSNPYDYDLLVAALDATGLDVVLDDASSTFTVFAPNDAAFMRTVADLTGSAPASEADALAAVLATFPTTAALSDVLLYHVVVGESLGFTDVLRSRTLTMANGGTVRPRGIYLRDETPALPDPRIVLKASGIQTTNGVIHTINRVLVPGA
jgi:uncharacterized surface protein with fasciclin (FAS1) repeats